MATYKLYANTVFALPAALRAGVATARRRLAHASWQAAARRDLMRLDDATLRDLGLSRSEIGSAVSEMSGDAELSRLRVGRRQRPSCRPALGA